jgi:hypothetical protein
MPMVCAYAMRVKFWVLDDIKSAGVGGCGDGGAKKKKIMGSVVRECQSRLD